jgi:uncharacterized protein
MKSMPQEIEVWYLIPALRKEIAKILVKNSHMTQKKVSKVLGISEGAISQYFRAKRGNELKFSDDELGEIRETAEKIFEDPEHYNEELYRLCVKFRGAESVCSFHKKHDKSLPKNCDLCC